MEQLVTALLVLVLLVPFVVFWWSMFSDLLKNDYPRTFSKTTWLFAFVMLNVFGAAMYYVYEYRKR